MPDAAGVQDGTVEAQGPADGQAIGSTRSKYRVRRSRAQKRTLLVKLCHNISFNLNTKFYPEVYT
jgi:hypothetical protein